VIHLVLYIFEEKKKGTHSDRGPYSVHIYGLSVHVHTVYTIFTFYVHHFYKQLLESADQYNFRGLGIVFEELVDKGVSFDEVRF